MGMNRRRRPEIIRDLFVAELDKVRKYDQGVEDAGRIHRKLPDPFADTKIHLDKDMMTKHSGGPDEAYEAYLPTLVPKAVGSLTMMIVTYDGAGYDYLSYEADHGGGITKEAFRKALEEKFPGEYVVEDFCTWAFGVYRR